MTPVAAESRCANCGRTAGPRFCPHCGQEVAGRRGPLVEVIREVASEWLSLDSRLLRSLRALVVPGKHSELYLAGHRAPFVRPFRLYLVASVLLFSTVLAFDNPSAENVDIYVGDELVSSAGDSEVSYSLQILGDSWVERLVMPSRERTVERLRATEPQEIVDRLAGGVRRILPLTLIAFLPFLALGLKLLYIRGRARHTLYFDHFVFAIHYQAALFLALAAAWLAARVLALFGGSPLLVVAGYAVVILAMPIVYLPMALRRFYGQSRWWTAVKTVILFGVYAQLMASALSLAIAWTFRDL